MTYGLFQMRVSTMAGGRQCLQVPVAGLLVLLLGVEVVEVQAGALVVREAQAESTAAGQAVPVIHLNNGKASVDEYLKLFPEQLLGNHQLNVFDTCGESKEDYEFLSMMICLICFSIK